MKLEGIKKTDDYIWLRYNTTYRMSWPRVLDLMQIFLDDICQEVSYIATLFIAGAEPSYIKTIKEGLLYRTEELKEEKGAVILAGKSKVYGAIMELTAYNQLKIVDVKISSKETQIIKEIEADNHLLDVYMNGLEINACVRDSQRYTIDLFGKFLTLSPDDADFEKTGKLFKEKCISLGATPFPEKKTQNIEKVEITCPACQHTFQYDESQIPVGAKYEVPCPKCSMLMKRKKE